MPSRGIIADLAFCALAAALILAATAYVTGCGYARHLDPEVYHSDTPRQALAEAQARAGSIGGTVYLVAPTGSMEPLLHGGDYLVVDPHTPFSALRAGQVVTYRAAWLPAGFTPVTHRIASIDADGLLMSGDSSPRSEPQWRVTPANYLGLVVAVFKPEPLP